MLLKLKQQIYYKTLNLVKSFTVTLQLSDVFVYVLFVCLGFFRLLDIY